jgi:hypothetical protein
MRATSDPGILELRWTKRQIVGVVQYPRQIAGSSNAYATRHLRWSKDLDDGV